MRQVLYTPFLFVLGCVPYLHADVNLVVNPSFETPVIAPGTYGLFASIPGWNITAGPAIELQNHIAGSPLDGNQFLELDSTGETAVFQDLATLPGGVYALGFAFSPRPGVAVNHMQVLWGGVPVFEINQSGVGLRDTAWTVYNFDVTATGATTRLQFSGLGPSDSLGEYVDAVSVAAVPEPSSIALCVTVLLGAALSRSKKLLRR